MSTWRYVQNGQPAGPIETSALQALLTNGTVSPETLVWKEGMPNWAPARTLPEFGDAGPPSAATAASPSTGTALPPVGGVPPPLGGSPPDPADVEKNKVYAVLAYVGLLFLVPLLAAPQSRFARYHTNQGIVLFLATTIVCGGSVILMFIPFVGCIATFVPLVASVGALVLMVIGIVNAASGQCKPLPLIGHFELIKS
jgi:uncharacterized membrane protein